MSEPADLLRGQIIEHCEQLIQHIKLLRDYATTPDNVWLARGELNQINERVGEVEALLAQLKEAD
ncbi:MAG TPA: hypothetical protein VMR75_02435 [Candidatus Saccharimonadales bacterium]|nr:hypothetical protein [Candidatus Saccharimonadales bacterium]